MPRPVLVLWDIDLTLLDPAGFGTRMISSVLAELLGREPVMGASFAGRTDRAILTDLLARNGIEAHGNADGSCGGGCGGCGGGGGCESCGGCGGCGSCGGGGDGGGSLSSCGGGDSAVLTLMDAVAERCEAFGYDLIAGGGGPLPGAREAVDALAANPLVHQGIVTGNMRRTALLKLRLCGFDGLPDPALGAFGDRHWDRAHLVRDAVSAARGRGLDISVSDAVVVGDHVHDVRGALDAGARCVGVATGRVSAAELHSAGADVVLSELTDTDALLAALRPAH